METPVVYAVSDTGLHGTSKRRSNAVVRSGHRAGAQAAISQIHWARVIALAVNLLIWITFIAIMAHVRLR